MRGGYDALVEDSIFIGHTNAVSMDRQDYDGGVDLYNSCFYGCANYASPSISLPCTNCFFDENVDPRLVMTFSDEEFACRLNFDSPLIGAGRWGDDIGPLF